MLDPRWSWPFIAERHPGFLKANISPKSSQRWKDEEELWRATVLWRSRKRWWSLIISFFSPKKNFSRRRIKKLEDDEFLISLETFSRTGLGSNLFWGERLPSLALSHSCTHTHAHTPTRTHTHTHCLSHIRTPHLSLSISSFTHLLLRYISLPSESERECVSVCEQCFV